MPVCITSITSTDKVIVTAVIETMQTTSKITKRWFVLKPERFAEKYTYISYDELHILPDELQHLQPCFIDTSLFIEIWQKISVHNKNNKIITCNK